MTIKQYLKSQGVKWVEAENTSEGAYSYWDGKIDAEDSGIIASSVVERITQEVYVTISIGKKWFTNHPNGRAETVTEALEELIRDESLEE